MVFLLVTLLGGGGTAYYFKTMKPKQDVKGCTDFYDFDKDEPEPNDTGDDGGRRGMTLFTDSPLERMMIQKPGDGRREKSLLASVPPRCKDCSYN